MDLRELPKGWIKNTLREVTTSQKGKLPKEFSEIPKDGFIPYIDIEAFETGNIKRFAAINATTIATPNDVLVVWDGARFGLSGKCGGGVVGSTIVKLSSDIVERDYLLNFIRLHYHTINSRPRGTGTPHVEPEVFWPLEIGIPPLNEQRRIVEKIETLFAQLDAGEAALKQVQQQLARYRQSVLKAAVTGALTADWRAENAHRLEHGRDLLARILKTRRENWQGRGKYKEPAVPDTSGLPELPQGWVWVSLEQLFDIYGGATPSRRDAKNWGGDLPWVSSGEVAFCRIETTKELITQAGYKSCSAKLHPVGTILLAMIGEGKTRGQAAILGIPACNNQNAAAIRVSESEIPSKFVYFYLMGRYEQSRKEGQGGNQPALNGAKVKAFLMPLACVDEMEEVVRKIEIAFDAAALTEIAIKTELTRAAALRQSILKDAFSGKLVPQDPNDEPADVLLARIRAERAQNIPAKTARGRKPSVRTKT